MDKNNRTLIQEKETLEQEKKNVLNLYKLQTDLLKNSDNKVEILRSLAAWYKSLASFLSTADKIIKMQFFSIISNY